MEPSHGDILAELRALRGEVAAVKEILEAWNSVKWLGRALKWLGGIAAALAAVMAFAKTVAAQIVWGVIR